MYFKKFQYNRGSFPTKLAIFLDTDEYIDTMIPENSQKHSFNGEYNKNYRFTRSHSKEVMALLAEKCGRKRRHTILSTDGQKPIQT